MSNRTKLVLGVSVGVLAVAGVVMFSLARHPIDGAGSMPERARADIELLADVLDQYHHDHGAYPTTEQGLDSLATGGYIRKLPHDPWGLAYHYQCPGTHNLQSYDLWSTGNDGRNGGEGLAQDVTNWHGA